MYSPHKTVHPTHNCTTHNSCTPHISVLKTHITVYILSVNTYYCTLCYIGSFFLDHETCLKHSCSRTKVERGGLNMLLLRIRRRTMPSPTCAHRWRTGQGVHVAPGYRPVPPQMPLRRVVSQSETISALSQYETLRRGLEAVYGPYSTSAPCARHNTRRDDRSTNEDGD